MENGNVAQAALDRALEDSEDLLLLYQPIHDARTRAIISAEALLRQRRQNGEVREASIITSAAERGPELFLLDSLTIQNAFSDSASWATVAPDVHLNVNLSPREFQERDIVAKLSKLLGTSAMDARRLNLEITETSSIEEPEKMIAALGELKNLGLQLWLDDFGTGHSSLTHLQHFPLDGIKLPGSFVGGIGSDRRCRAITRSLIALAHELGLQVVAEGVEDDQQLEFLLEHGCEYVQGFLFSKPMPLGDLCELLKSGR